MPRRAYHLLLLAALGGMDSLAASQVAPSSPKVSPAVPQERIAEITRTVTRGWRDFVRDDLDDLGAIGDYELLQQLKAARWVERTRAQVRHQPLPVPQETEVAPPVITSISEATDMWTYITLSELPVYRISFSAEGAQWSMDLTKADLKVFSIGDGQAGSAPKR